MKTGPAEHGTIVREGPGKLTRSSEHVDLKPVLAIVVAIVVVESWCKCRGGPRLSVDMRLDDPSEQGSWLTSGW